MMYGNPVMDLTISGLCSEIHVLSGNFAGGIV